VYLEKISADGSTAITVRKADESCLYIRGLIPVWILPNL
jgi:hypothetical protein